MMTQQPSGLSARYAQCLSAFGAKMLRPNYQTADEFRLKYLAYKLSELDSRRAAASTAATPAPVAPVRSEPTPKPKPRRAVTEQERASELWASALHESAHVAASIIYGRGCDFAEVLHDGSGMMLPRGPITRQIDERITAAAWSVCSAFGFNGSGLSSDFAQLRERGLRAVRTGDSYSDGFLPYQESTVFKSLRDEIRRDLAPHERQILALADELYLRCGERVSGDELKRIWDAC